MIINMESLRFLYNIGYGPSSSHTMGPVNAVSYVKSKHPTANSFNITLYNSLALTGLGHLTYASIERELSPSLVHFNTVIDSFYHPNFMTVVSYRDGIELGKDCIESVGGGRILINGQRLFTEEVYKYNSFEAIKNYCVRKEMSLFDYVLKSEGISIKAVLSSVWSVMKKSVKQGLRETGVLPGELRVQRRAKRLYDAAKRERGAEKEALLLSAFAFSVSEENAAGGVIVTAPTCGSCGVFPAVLYYMYKYEGFIDEQIEEALAVASIFGNLIKQNASISGAVAGCQAEIGTAAVMAASAVAYLRNLSIGQIEYSAEVALEHSLGLTCDPVKGYVQIPCIERNAVYAVKAYNAARLARIISKGSKVSFDMVVQTMLQTGKDIAKEYRETAEGGLAKHYKERRKR